MSRKQVTLALLVLAFFAIHGGFHIYRGEPYDLLWACHIGAVSIGAGLLLSAPVLTAIGAFWLSGGFPLWIFDLTQGSEFLLTSTLIHVGGLIIGYAGMKILGLPRYTWALSITAFAALMLLSHYVTPPAANVNLSHRVYDGSLQYFPSYPWYLTVLLAGFTTGFAALEWTLRRLGFATP